MAKIWYSVNKCRYCRYEFDDDLGYVDSGELMWAELLASEMGDDYYTHHDGWEDSWPTTFYIYRNEDDAEPVCKVEVQLEFEPAFSAEVIEEDL
jgi:hypothetical protein